MTVTPPLLFCPENVVCFLHLLHIFMFFRLDSFLELNNMNPDQTAPEGAV